MMMKVKMTFLMSLTQRMSSRQSGLIHTTRKTLHQEQCSKLIVPLTTSNRNLRRSMLYSKPDN
jgi:hypothetical protein